MDRCSEVTDCRVVHGRCLMFPTKYSQTSLLLSASCRVICPVMERSVQWMGCMLTSTASEDRPQTGEREREPPNGAAGGVLQNRQRCASSARAGLFPTPNTGGLPCDRPQNPHLSWRSRDSISAFPSHARPMSNPNPGEVWALWDGLVSPVVERGGS